MAVIDRHIQKPVHFVTLEKGITGSFFLCAFAKDGSHRNMGRGEEFSDEAVFVKHALALVQREFGVELSELSPAGSSADVRSGVGEGPSSVQGKKPWWKSLLGGWEGEKQRRAGRT